MAPLTTRDTDRPPTLPAEAAEYARAAVHDHAMRLHALGCQPRDLIIDLLADLMHYADQHGPNPLEFSQLIEEAARAYALELGTPTDDVVVAAASSA